MLSKRERVRPKEREVLGCCSPGPGSPPHTAPPSGSPPCSLLCFRWVSPGGKKKPKAALSPGEVQLDLEELTVSSGPVPRCAAPPFRPLVTRDPPPSRPAAPPASSPHVLVTGCAPRSFCTGPAGHPSPGDSASLSLPQTTSPVLLPSQRGGVRFHPEGSLFPLVLNSCFLPKDRVSIGARV